MIDARTTTGLFFATTLLVAACGDSGTSSGSGGSGTGGGSTDGSGGMTTSGSGGAPAACPGSGAEITDLPACAANTASPVNVPEGCEPTVDGTLHADEWSDGECFLAGDMTVVVKYGADTLYVAASGQPTCGCPMGFYFDPDPGAAGDEFALALFDDPFETDGDRGDFVFDGSMWVQGAAPAGIVTKCPGNQPTPVRYEIEMPYSALGLTAGTAHDVGFAFVHAGVHWPAGLSVGASGTPDDLSTFGKLSASW
ncbi:MAG TPA: hypothetical protein VL400_22405 [Polyangiaceae bacterium]|nr:hypothetical protein [Polyangiaceae bacterium]